jgi:hypothetical protein
VPAVDRRQPRAVVLSRGDITVTRTFQRSPDPAARTPSAAVDQQIGNNLRVSHTYPEERDL